jgi:hypothetical protein
LIAPAVSTVHSIEPSFWSRANTVPHSQPKMTSSSLNASGEDSLRPGSGVFQSSLPPFAFSANACPGSRFTPKSRWFAYAGAEALSWPIRFCHATLPFGVLSA